jgi:hypothetical protein
MKGDDRQHAASEGEGVPERDLATIREAAAILGVEEAVLRHAVESGELQVISWHPSVQAVDMAELERYRRERLDNRAMDDETNNA